MKVPEFRRIEMWASSIFQKTLSLISPLTTVIYYRTGITGKTDRQTHKQTNCRQNITNSTISWRCNKNKHSILNDEWMKWLLIYRLSSGQWPDLKAVHSTYHRLTDGLPTWVEQSKDTCSWSSSSFPTIIYSGLNHFFSFFVIHISFFLWPHTFIFIYTVHAGCLYVTDTLSTQTCKQQIKKKIKNNNNNEKHSEKADTSTYLIFDLYVWPWLYVKVKKAYIIRCRLLYCIIVPYMLFVSVIVCEMWQLVHFCEFWPSSVTFSVCKGHFYFHQ